MKQKSFFVNFKRLLLKQIKQFFWKVSVRLKKLKTQIRIVSVTKNHRIFNQNQHGKNQLSSYIHS